MSASGFLDLLDLVLKQSGLSDREGPVRLDEFASRCVEFLTRIQAHNLGLCDEVTCPDCGDFREKAIADLECLLAETCFTEEWNGRAPTTLGGLVARVSSRYIDLQYAFAQPADDANLRRINEILADLADAKLELARSLKMTGDDLASPTRPEPDASLNFDYY